jgi:hypothetical protein
VCQKAQIETEAEDEENRDERVGQLAEHVGGVATEGGFRCAAAQSGTHSGVGAGALHKYYQDCKQTNDCQKQCQSVSQINHEGGQKGVFGGNNNAFFTSHFFGDKVALFRIFGTPFS